MKTLKKTLCLVLAVVMALGVLVLPASAAEAEKTDADAEAAFKDTLYASGIINGTDGDHSASYDDVLTRQEVAAIVYRIMTGDTNKDTEKKDNSAIYASAANEYKDAADIADWAKGYVGYLTDKGIFGGDENHEFKPEDPVTLTQLVKVMLCCMGYGKMEGEFSGANWDDKVLTTASTTNMFGGTGLYTIKDVDMSKEAKRADVYKVIANAITLPRVTIFNGTYSNHRDPARPNLNNNGADGTPLNTPLVTIVRKLGGVETTAIDKFGIPTTTKSAVYDEFTFNNPVIAKVVDNETAPATPVNNLYYNSNDLKPEQYDREDMCDVVKIMNDNKAGVETDPTKAKSTYTLIVNGVRQTGTFEFDPTDVNTMIGETGTHTLIYKNLDTTSTAKFVMVQIDTFLAEVHSVYTGADKDKNDHPYNSGTSGNLWIYKVSGKLGDKSLVTSVTYEDAKTEADVGKLFGVTGYWKNGKGDADDEFVLASDPATTDEKMYALTGTAVTVDAIERDERDEQDTIIGFESGSIPYIFSTKVTYKNSKIDESSLGDKVVIYTSKRNRVLHYEADTAAAGFLIVDTATSRKIGTGKYVIDVTGYGLNGKLLNGTITLTGNGWPFEAPNSADAEAQAENYIENALQRFTLIHYVENPDNGYFYIDNHANRQDYNGNWDPDEAVLKPGDVSFRGFSINSETEFLVAEYRIDNKTLSPNDYKFVQFNSYEFRTIPVLRAENGCYVVGFEDMREMVLVQAYTENGTPAGPGELAKYVVVTGATKQLTAQVEKMPDMAYIYGVSKVYDNKYVFNTFVNGKDRQLEVALNAGKGVQQNLGKLYTFADYANGSGYSDVEEVNGNEGGMLLAGGYVLENGVLCGIDQNGNPYPVCAVSTDVEIFTIAPAPGDIHPVNEGVLDANAEDHDIWFQLDGTGMVRYIYIDMGPKEPPASSDPSDPTDPPKPETNYIKYVFEGLPAGVKFYSDTKGTEITPEKDLYKNTLTVTVAEDAELYLDLGKTNAGKLVAIEKNGKQYPDTANALGIVQIQAKPAAKAAAATANTTTIEVKLIIDPLTFSVYDSTDTTRENALATFYYSAGDKLNGKTILHVDPNVYAALDADSSGWVASGVLKFDHGDIKIDGYTEGLMEDNWVTVRKAQIGKVDVVLDGTKVTTLEYTEGVEETIHFILSPGQLNGKVLSTISIAESWMGRVKLDENKTGFYLDVTGNVTWFGGLTINLTTATPADPAKDYGQDGKTEIGGSTAHVNDDPDMSKVYSDVGITVEHVSGDQITITVDKATFDGVKEMNAYKKLLEGCADKTDEQLGELELELPADILVGVGFTRVSADATITNFTYSDGKTTMTFDDAAIATEVAYTGGSVFMYIPIGTLVSSVATPKLAENGTTWTISYVSGGILFNWTVTLVIE